MERNLETLLEKKRRHSKEDRSKLESKKEDWLKRIAHLYDEIETWLQPLINKGYVRRPEREAYEIREELLGSYFSGRLVITFFNGTAIELVPKGLQVVGANGRIDMQLGGLLVMILGRENGTGWDFIEAFGQRFGQSRFGEGSGFGGIAQNPFGRSSEPLPFNKENFESLLAEFVKGF